MTEKKILIDALRLEYSGIFDVNELFRVIDHSILERGYIKNEKKHEELVRSDGKEVNLELRPVKEFETDFWGMQKLRIRISKLKNTTIESHGIKRSFRQGDILITFDSWTTTYLEWAWETQPIYVFFRMLYDKYIYKWFSDKHEGEIIADTYYLYDKIKGHLNLYKYYNEQDTGREEEKAMKVA